MSVSTCEIQDGLPVGANRSIYGANQAHSNTVLLEIGEGWSGQGEGRGRREDIEGAGGGSPPKRIREEPHETMDEDTSPVLESEWGAGRRSENRDSRRDRAWLRQVTKRVSGLLVLPTLASG
jgi:hypothetical protein